MTFIKKSNQLPTHCTQSTVSWRPCYIPFNIGWKFYWSFGDCYRTQSRSLHFKHTLGINSENSMHIIFQTCYQNLLTNFKTKFHWSASRNLFRGMVYKNWWFPNFRAHLIEISISFHKTMIGINIKFLRHILKICLVALEKRLRIPILDDFFNIFSLSTWTMIFFKKLVQYMLFHAYWEIFW